MVKPKGKHQFAFAEGCKASQTQSLNYPTLPNAREWYSTYRIKNNPTLPSPENGTLRIG